jgi:LysR substrate binding domain
MILNEVAAAAAEVHRFAEGVAGAVRVGVTPPVSPVLAHHLSSVIHTEAPDVDISIRRMWLHDLERVVAEHEIDVAITFGPVSVGAGAAACPRRRGDLTSRRGTADTDLSAHKWPTQSEVDWILTTASIAAPDMPAAIRPVGPRQLIPYTIHWAPGRNRNPAVSHFVRTACRADVPVGWTRLSGQFGSGREISA